MPNNDGEEERADGGVETVDFDALEDDDLPEWATEEASVPATEPTHPEPTDSPEPTPDEPASGPEDGPSEPTPEGDDAGADEPVDAATAVNFANVETGASASVSVGWSRTEADYGDTGGTSIDPDLDDVDPSTLLDEIDDGEFPRPGASGTDTAESAVAEDTAATTEGRSLVPDDLAVAFGVGAVVLLVAAVLYLLLVSVLSPATAGLAIATTLVAAAVVGLVAAADRRY